MEDFVDRADILLHALLAREALPNNGICVCGTKNQAIWRCKDCTSPALMCRSCMRHSHAASPLHHIECWTGTFFRTAYLWEVGSYILVPHYKHIQLCDSLLMQQRILESVQVAKDIDEQARLSKPSGYLGPAMPEMPELPEFILMDDGPLDNTADESEEDNRSDLDYMKEYLANNAPRQDVLTNHYVRIVHTNGIHRIALVTCSCHGADAIHADLMYCRLVPTTFTSYNTLFTVTVLDDFRISNLECKALAYQYFQKLRCQTCPMALATCPNVYQELLRMSRLWRWLKKKKWACQESGCAGYRSK